MFFDLRGIHWVNIMRTTWQTVSRIVSKILDQLNIPFYSISVSGQQDHRHASRAFSCSATFTVGQWRHIEAESGGSCWVTSCVWKVKRRNCVLLWSCSWLTDQFDIKPLAAWDVRNITNCHPHPEDRKACFKQFDLIADTGKNWLAGSLRPTFLK